MTGTEYVYRKHYAADGETVLASGLQRYVTTISAEHLGEEQVLIHELSHVIHRHRCGPDSEVHGSEFVAIKDAMRVAFGYPPTGKPS